MKLAHPDRIIPLDRLAEGLRLCAQNVRDFIVDARLLLSKGHGYHAIALAIFAFEELGKYSELKTLGDEAKRLGMSSLTVKDVLFSRHDYKQNIAKNLLVPDAMMLLTADFDPKAFDPKAFATEDVAVEPILRLDCVFVDWRECDWIHGTPHDTERLKVFLDAIMDALNKLAV
jgi:AbiV family abortive infection protein